MELIEESLINRQQVKYYNGFDLELIINHPKDGSGGMMVVFFNSVKIEETKYKRHQIILNLLESKQIQNFNDILENIDNPYLTLYETHGYTDIIYKSIKLKLEVIRDYSFRDSDIIWSKINI
jgi:hypothetical protein